MQRLPEHARSAVMFGVVAGFIIGALYVAIELLSDLTIRKSVYAQWPWLRGGYGAPTTMAVADTDINRNALVVALMLWPTLAAGRWIRPEWLRRIAIVSVIVLACTAVSLSSSQSAILTLVVGTLAAALSYFSPRHALRLVAVCWVITVVSVVPLVQGIAALGYQHDMRIPFSVRDRIAIWGHTASLVKQAPFFGAGLYAGRARDEMNPATRDPITSIGATTGRHAHNFYLQTWFELGGVGAALLLATGLALLATVRKLTPDSQRAPLTVFAAGAASIATSFGLEQLWLHATLMITACLIILAAPRAGAHEVA
jgi:O-antigen ligase